MNATAAKPETAYRLSRAELRQRWRQLADIGMRVPDVVWASPEFMAQHRSEKQLRAAPDLCIEVLSPTKLGFELTRPPATGSST